MASLARRLDSVMTVMLVTEHERHDVCIKKRMTARSGFLACRLLRLSVRTPENPLLQFMSRPSISLNVLSVGDAGRTYPRRAFPMSSSTIRLQ